MSQMAWDGVMLHIAMHHVKSKLILIHVQQHQYPPLPALQDLSQLFQHLLLFHQQLHQQLPWTVFMCIHKEGYVINCKMFFDVGILIYLHQYPVSSVLLACAFIVWLCFVCLYVFSVVAKP